MPGTTQPVNPQEPPNPGDPSPYPTDPPQPAAKPIFEPQVDDL